MVSVYAVAGYRTLPAAQQIYGSVTQILYSTPAIDLVHGVLQPEGTNATNDNSNIKPNSNNLHSAEIGKLGDIVVKNVDFRYNNNGTWVFQDLNFTIKHGKNKSTHSV